MKKYILPVTIGFLTVGISMMLIGIYRGEFSIVFTKAVNICLECIGIG